MKIEFKRDHGGGEKFVTLSLGGEWVTSVGAGELKRTDWKNASEAKHACREELQKWIDEEDLPALPDGYRVERDYGDVDLIHIGFGTIATVLPSESKEDLEREAEESEVIARFFRWATERKSK